MTDAGRLARSLPEAGKFARYLVVGAAANLFALSIYYGATLGAGVEPKRALTLATVIAFFPAYAANRAWTFRARAGPARSLLRYGAGYVASFALQAAILHLGVDVLGQRHEWVVLVGLAFATAFFFLLQRFWVFSGAEPARPAGGRV
ncbi:MAG TPA: GtrA family protein [Beijerinckiaceae bacterium]